MMKFGTLNQSDYDKNDLNKIQIFKFKMAGGRHIGKHRFWLQRRSGLSDFHGILYEDAKSETNGGRMWQYSKSADPRWRTSAILKIIILTHCSK